MRRHLVISNKSDQAEQTYFHIRYNGKHSQCKGVGTLPNGIPVAPISLHLKRKYVICFCKAQTHDKLTDAIVCSWCIRCGSIIWPTSAILSSKQCSWSQDEFKLIFVLDCRLRIKSWSWSFNYASATQSSCVWLQNWHYRNRRIFEVL